MSACIIWKGAIQSAGYGNTGQGLAHRVAYKKAYGAFPNGLQVRHLCGNKLCVNPKHLAIGTQADNEQDKKAHGTFNHNKPYRTHCKRGHSIGIDGDVWFDKYGYRHCNECRRIVQRTPLAER